MMMLCMTFKRYMCGSQIGSYLSARIFKYMAFALCGPVCNLEFLDFEEDHNIFKGANKDNKPGRGLDEVCSTIRYWSSTKCFNCSSSHKGIYKIFMYTVIMQQ
uniref:Predicted protein n=1 Tax=Hordeum vulgare subsp. vulgare TaxID=112509 RepID=F2E4M4_HORVV|nr:predicted protein [Hordeum vulgare subsp. vulgare]